MDNTDYRQNISVQYCFPNNNASCRKEVHGGPGYIFVCIFLSCISVCTVLLNLLVIISISHFKQLHTPTNLLILSLAVADLLVGLLVIPVNMLQLLDTCWYYGKMACIIFPLFSYFSVLASVFSLVLIAVDRYIAVCNPLIYPSIVTNCKMSICIILGWSCCLLYDVILYYYNDHLIPTQLYETCYGECLLVIQHSWIMIDLVLIFVMPCSVIVILYAFIFKAAKHQAKTVKAISDGASQIQGTKISGSSHTKAAKKLGTIIFVYLACWIPYYLSSLCVESLTSSSVVWTVFTFVLYMNSALNPLLYSVFYSWFRVSVKYIVTCKIFESSSSRINLALCFTNH